MKTVDDFGSQGEAPSHPELLDWLATEFIRIRLEREGGCRKPDRHERRLPAVFTRAAPQVRERDPENPAAGARSRFRLPAEVIRDQALSAAGLLDVQDGRPAGEAVPARGLVGAAFGDGENKKLYVLSKGDDLWRRSVYTYWKRTAPPPAMTTFDAPTREYCVVNRGAAELHAAAGAGPAEQRDVYRSRAPPGRADDARGRQRAFPHESRSASVWRPRGSRGRGWRSTCCGAGLERRMTAYTA